jgi:hypothetical protein
MVVKENRRLWDITPFRVNRYFGRICRLQLHGQGMGKVRRQREASHSCAYCLLHVSISLGLFFDPGDGSDMLLRNIA